MSKVFIGVGHGGVDSGAVGLNGIKEKDLNLAIAQYARAELERNGVQVLMSRYKDENDSLADEIKECNSYAPDLAIDFHNNAGGGDGFEAYHYRKGGTSKELALNIEREVLAIGQNSRGCKVKLNGLGTDYFGFIRKTNAPAVLCEFAFVDTKDVYIIDTPAEQQVIGIAAAKGILKTLGITWKAHKMGRWCVGNFNPNTKDRADVKAHLEGLRKIGYGVWYEEI